MFDSKANYFYNKIVKQIKGKHMSKNKVNARCQKEDHAKFYYASQKMFLSLKYSRVFLYMLAIIPVILALIPSVSARYAFVCSIVAFSLSLLNEVLSSFLNNYKKKAIMVYQLYETGITGSQFAKVEYDRETTNDLNELAIRKGLYQVRGKENLYTVDVPDEVSDDYSYLYLCRRSAATANYLLSRMFYIYLCTLIAVVAGFVAAIFFKSETIEYLTLIITVYPVVSPIIKACGKCKECMKDCIKICADIDNYFADGDVSVERLARMYYYVQNLEFEMMLNRPTMYKIFGKMFKRGVANLQDGVTMRFQSAIVELKSKAMMQKGIISQPKGKSLITMVDYEDQLTKLEKKKKDHAVKAEPTKQKVLPQKTQNKVAGLKVSNQKTKQPASTKKSTTPKKSTSKNSATSKQAQKKATAKKSVSNKPKKKTSSK